MSLSLVRGPPEEFEGSLEEAERQGPRKEGDCCGQVRGLQLQPGLG